MKNKKWSISTVAIVVGLGTLATAAYAELTATDILNELHASNQQEIHMGRLAEQKGFSNDTRDYGKTLISDHESADEKVMKVATKEGIALKPVKEGLVMKMEMKKLDMHSGAEFDKDFGNAMVSDHKKDISKLQKAQAADLPTDVRNLIADLLPTLQKHLELAQKISG